MRKVTVSIPLLILVFQAAQAQSQAIQNFLNAGSTCGKSKFSEGRINGGDEAVAHDWPWQVLLHCTVSRHKIAICGGILISDKWVLTAAHCVETDIYNYTKCTVRLGKHTLKPGLPEDSEVYTEIAYRAVHEQFVKNKTFLGYDIALLKLDRNFTFTSAIQPICMPFGLPELEKNSTCYTTGWGRYEDQKITKALRQLKMPLQDPLYCGFTSTARSPVICAGQKRRMENICHGDSGGPLACKESNGRWTVRGVVSMVERRCFDDASYTKVAAFEDWIKLTVSKH